ncbi:MAG: penicillin-binding protein [Parcubacteria group bacterium]|nr:penicillin-binding protein [Parcubacteria group bacterium]
MRKRRFFLKNTLLVLFAIGLFSTGGLLLWASTLQIPDLETFDERRVVETTKIYDRTGEVLLYEANQDIQRTSVPFDLISRHLKNATVAIEDAEFYDHSGIKPTAILRAVIVNIFSLGFEQGGSTITQQVVKNSLLTSKKTIPRKLKEWVLALKIEGVMTKEEILELYLNEAPYGGSIYGVEEASRAFFNKGAEELSLNEAAYLASLPQAPTYYSPYGNNREALDQRKDIVLGRMLELGFITEEEHAGAKGVVASFEPAATLGIRAPHFVFYVLEQLEGTYGRERVENGGFRVITTLDYGLQEKAEEIVRRYAEENVIKFKATNAGLIAIDPKTGQVLVMVGSKNYFAEDIDGNFNVTTKPNRQPGSAFKPFVYATALEKGYTADTVVFDLPTQFSTECDAKGKPLSPDVKEETCYMPQNYDEKFRGPITFRDALAQSINVPAVKVLYLSGLQDSLKTARNMGITSLNDPNRYGLTLVLGGGEVSLIEMTSAYSVFANKGVRNPHYSIIEVRDGNGEMLESSTPKPKQVLSPEIAGTITDILSDNKARTPAFGASSPLYFPGRDVAAKTGTTNDSRDAWIIGYTPNIAVGAWVGNNDNSEMVKSVAGFIVAPMWNAFMKTALEKLPDEPFASVSYDYPDGFKPVLRGVWQGGETYTIDTVSGNLATAHTPEETRREVVLTDVHSILYWLNKGDPRGPRPAFPEEDSQFLLWEEPVLLWAAGLGLAKEASPSIPQKYDEVHKPEYAPSLAVFGLDETTYHKRNERVSFAVTGSGAHTLSRVDLFINNTYVGMSDRAPFQFSFVPGNVSGLKNENKLTLVGYDTVKNKGVREFVFLVED